MKVKITISAAGANFVLIYGQEMEFDDVKALIGNGAENFCLPVDPLAEWPPATAAEAPIVEPEQELPDEVPADQELTVEPLATVVEAPSEPGAAVTQPVVETAAKPRGRAK